MSIQQISDALAAYQKTTGLNNHLNLTGDANSLDKEGLSFLATKTTQQTSLVAHFFKDPSQKEDNAAKMVYQAAIAKLNDILSPHTPKDENGKSTKESKDAAPISEETLKKQGGMDYWSPENTAKRIVSSATLFLEGFKKAHPDLEGKALIDKYMEVVGGGLNQGFNEAKDILSNLKVFNGTVKDNYANTFDLVQKGIKDFKNEQLGIKPTPEATNTPSVLTSPQKA